MTTSAPPPLASPTEERIDVVSGDRCCAGCGFNLRNQTIIREPHYRMLIVRCPECGTPAAIQEYPTLSRMTTRLWHLLAAAWVGAIVAGMVITAAFAWGWAEVVQGHILRPYRDAVSHAWRQYENANVPAGQRGMWWTNPSVVQQWWEGLPPDRFFADFGGWSALNWPGLVSALYAMPFLIPLGIIWSVVLPRLRGVRLAAVVFVPMLIAGVFAFFYRLLTRRVAAFYYEPGELVNTQVGGPVMAAAILTVGLGLIAGALVGRPIARAFLRLTLPPNLLAAFSFLWFLDGHPLPQPLPARKPG